MKKNTIITIILVLIISIAVTLIFKWWIADNLFHPATILFTVTFFLQLYTGLIIGRRFFAHFMDKPVRQIKRLIIPYFILCLVIILSVCMVIIGLSLYIYYLIMGIDTSGFLSMLFRTEYPNALKYSFFFVLPASVFFFYTIWRQAIDNEQRLREENLKYQYRTLKAQVNPHFLFNSLNTLSEIVYEDAQKADNYIQKLSGIYRYILDNEETDSISLSKEIEFVNRYFELQKERDGNKIVLSIDIPDAGKYQIIPVSLQILVENAFKHNSMSENRPLKISIYKEDTVVVVINNIQRKNTLDNSYGIGLNNLKERVKLITGREMAVNQENNKFTVKIPIISI